MIRTLDRSGLGERMYTADEDDINLNAGSRSVSDEGGGEID